MREERIVVRPFEMISTLKYEGLQEFNEHGYVKVSGLIQSAKKEEYVQKAMTESEVQILICDEQDDEKNLFCGILKNFKCYPSNDGVMLELCIYTGSKRMDYKTYKRSFQREGYTYRQIAELCNEDEVQSSMIMTAGKDSSVPGFIMQYNETNWAFLKRISSFLNTDLVPACNMPGAKYFFGVPEKKAAGGLNTQDYTIHQEDDIEGTKRNTISYSVESRDIYALGDNIDFNGKPMCIWKIETSLKGNELFHTYFLKKKSDIQVPKAYQKEMIGLSLMGRIKAVEGEQVTIDLDADENTESGNRWFAFSTVYSSADGAGWYCMPEIGDAVRLYFPTEDENDAYVTSAVHENKGNGLRTDPSNKIWRNKEGKEIRLTPERILLTNNKGMSVELLDGKGIKIKSNASVTIDASGDVSISSSDSGIEMAASGKIVFQQGDTKMELADGIKLSGATIKMQ